MKRPSRFTIALIFFHLLANGAFFKSEIAGAVGFFPSCPLPLPRGFTCEKLTIQAPQEFQVSQRDPEDSAAVKFGVSTLGKGKLLRLTVVDAQNNVVTTKIFPVGAGKTTLAGVLPVPAGGWYKLWMQELAADGSKVLGEGLVSHFGVGEVFVAAGQSNSVAMGQAPQESADLTSVAVLAGPEKLAWRHKIDAGSGGSPWPVFASLLSQRLHLPVAIVEVGCGGSSSSQWLPAKKKGAEGATALAQYCGADVAVAGGLFERLIHSTANLGGTRAVLWHQGEADTVNGETAVLYHDRVSAIISGLNKTRAPGSRIPWLVANASYVPGKEVDAATCMLRNNPVDRADEMLKVRAGQQALWADHMALPGPDTDMLIGSDFRFPGKAGACIHFSDDGLKMHGKLWYRAVLESGLLPEKMPEPANPRVPVYRFVSKNWDYFHSTCKDPGINGSLRGPTTSPTLPCAPKDGDPNLSLDPWVSSIGCQAPGPEYTSQGPVFSLLSHQAGVALYQCTHKSGSHFLSTDPGCESGSVQGRLGYLAVSPTEIQSRPLVRFFANIGGKNMAFFSATSMDLGLKYNSVYQGLQGFVYP